MRKSFVVLSALLASAPLAAQQAASDLTLDGIFGGRAFASAPMPEGTWTPDGRGYVMLRPNAAGGSDIVRMDMQSGDVAVLLDASAMVDSAGKRIEAEGLALSADATQALVYHNSARVWRQNTKGLYHMVDLKKKSWTPLSLHPGYQMFAKFSPDGRQVAFVRENNIYVVDVATRAEHAVTTDGSENIINGTSDWVYEEELNVRDGFRWSPDSKRIAFWRFDQSGEPQYPILDQHEVHARTAPIRYPQPGDPNAEVKIGVADAAAGHTVWMQTEADSGYVPTIAWIDADTLAIQRLNRHQSRIDLLFASGTSGVARRVLVETDSAWVDLDDDAPHLLAGGKLFLWPSERSGWRRYYLMNREGTVVRALTPDSVDAIEVAGIAAKTQEIFIQEAGPSPLDRQIFSYDLERKPERRPVTSDPGWHRVDVSPSGKLFIDVHHAAGLPPQAMVRELPTLAALRILEGNIALRAKLAAAIKPPEFFRMPMPDGSWRNAWRIVAPGFDSTKKHPVVIYVYGGPNSQTVVNAYGGPRELWHHLLAKNGYVVVSVDGRGTGARGAAFRHQVYQRLGQLESEDQMNAARWIGRQRWADSTHIAIWGWSGGGYMTALTASRGGYLFRSAISVAPVIDWRLYDDIYTERYMRTPAENPDGYTNGSVMTYASGLTARLLIVHGTSDDNVHPQNSLWMINALQAAGIQFEMMFYPGRTHSISGGTTQLHLYTMMTAFLDRTIGAGSVGGQ